ncbi:MAG: peptidoglycan DD-metalloendopeptidase family protein [Mailhella sp.]|nr:peptidoglycan DD-metalloendopeptidase family protein [Mailhella sp.]
MKKLVFCLLFLFSAFTASLASEVSVPAKVSQGHAFPVSVQDDRPFTAVFRWRGEELKVRAVKNGPLWKAELLLAMPIDAVKEHVLSIELPEEQQDLVIAPLKVKWHESLLKVEPKYVQPPAKAMKQIERDRRRIRRALASRTEKRWALPIARPVPGGITSAFGGRRVFNGQPRAPHKGTDMRCQEGTPVKAACAGTVLLAENTYFGGKSIYVDHGQGVISSYSHLSAFDVKAGDSVRKGQTIGRSGSTGRVTGPHLHFGLTVQGVAVDAMPLLSSPPDFTGGPSRSIFDQNKASKPRSTR